MSVFPSSGCAPSTRPGMTTPRRASLFILPFRLALLDEGADALNGVARHHVLGHDLRCEAVGLGEVHLGLAVEGLLAELDGIGRFARDLLRQRNRGVALVACGNDV